MKKPLSLLLVVSLLAAPLAGRGEGKRYDFQFRAMDLRKVVLSVAALAGRSVQFSQSVGLRPIDVTLKNVTPEFALRLVLESYGYVSLLKGNVYHVMTAAERGPAASPMIVIPMKNTIVTDIEDNVRTFLGSAGSLSANKSMNALIVSAPDDVIARLRRVVEQLDQEATQVFIEAKIVETSTTFSRSLGIEWGPNVTNRPPVNGISFRSPGNDDTIRLGFTTGLGPLGSLQARLTAGERNGEVKVISQPKITTLNGVPAAISSNLTFNIRTLAGTGAGASQVGAIQAVRAGLTLNVTPYIVSDDKVRLQIQVQKSDPDFSAKIDGIPGISDKSASTSLIVGSGQVASIGGLVSSNDSTTVQGIPFFTRLPIIGGLFGNNDREKKDNELMIFLTPSVYRGTARVLPFQSDNDGVISDDNVKKSAGEGAIGASPQPPAGAASPAVPLPAPSAGAGAVSLPDPTKALPEPAKAQQPLAPKEGSVLPSLTIPGFIRDATKAPAPGPAKAPESTAPSQSSPLPPGGNAALTLPPVSGTAFAPPSGVGAPPTAPAPTKAISFAPPAPTSKAPPVLPLATKAAAAPGGLKLPELTKGPAAAAGTDTAALDALLGPIPAPTTGGPAPAASTLPPIPAAPTQKAPPP